MFHETSLSMDKEPSGCYPSLYPAQQSLILIFLLSPEPKGLSLHGSIVNSWLINTNKGNLEASNLQLEVLHGVPTLLLSKRCNHCRNTGNIFK